MGNIATTIDQQIEKLEQRGMVLDWPVEKIKEVLLDIGYYRLGFYWHPFEIDDDHSVVAETKFSTILELYYMDVDLRHLLIKYINRIELSFRTKIIYYVSNINKKSPTWFVDPKVVDSAFIKDFDMFYNEEFKKISVIAKHHKRYINDKYAPAWKTLEYFTFGTNLKIYKSLLDIGTKERISKIFGVNDVQKFIQIMSVVVFVRNYCAHSGVVFDLRNTYGIPKLPFYSFNNNDRHCLDSCIKVIVFILEQISSNRADELRISVSKLFKEYAEKDKAIKDIILRKINFSL